MTPGAEPVKGPRMRAAEGREPLTGVDRRKHLDRGGAKPPLLEHCGPFAIGSAMSTGSVRCHRQPAAVAGSPESCGLERNGPHPSGCGCVRSISPLFT